MIRATFLALVLVVASCTTSTANIVVSPIPPERPEITGEADGMIMVICGAVATLAVAQAMSQVAASAMPAVGVAGIALTMICGDFAGDGQLDFDWGSRINGGER